MQIVFMGSGSFAVPVVRAIRNAVDDQLVAVVTQPDRPRGRGQGLAACPVKEAMRPTGVPVLNPGKIGDAEQDLRDLRPDLIVVADYGQYIPAKILDLPARRAINVHPSLLPKYRGAAPIPWAIANGDTMTGVTIQYLAKKMDSGDILLQQEFDIEADESSADLERRLSDAGAALLLRALNAIRTGHVHATPQDETHATYARKLEKADGKIDWSLPAETIRNRVRAFHPWPGTFCRTRDGMLKVLQARAESGLGSPGKILSVDDAGIVIATGAGAVRLIEVQPEGRRPMKASAYANGARLTPGQEFAP